MPSSWAQDDRAFALVDLNQVDESAQWQFEFTPYMFIPANVEGDSTVSGTTVDINLGIDDILENFDVLREVDTDSVEPTGHSVGVTSVMRDDVVAESSPRDEALANAPRREGDFVRVRAVLE